MKFIIQNLSAALLTLVLFSAKSQNVVYVSQGGTGTGTSWADAAGNLKAVLENAAAGTVIWVKEGTYYPTTCDTCAFNDRNQRFTIPDSVKLFGGFGGSETSLGERNWQAHPTYLSGDIDGDGTPANNSYTIIYTQHVSSETVVDGFIITGGNAEEGGAGLGTPQTSGAGWFNLGSVSGISNPVIANCTFADNHAWGYGGGMFNDGTFNGNCSPMLTNCTFTGNSARNGGGAFYGSASFDGQCNATITDCLFENNQSELFDGGAIFNIGSDGGVCNAVLTNCTFTGNTAFSDGGAVYNLSKGGNCSPILQNCVFENNGAVLGGAVFNDGAFNGYCGTVFTDCQFIGNHSSSDGGAIYNSGYQGTCNPEFRNCLFDENHSAFAAGAVLNNGIEGVCNPSFINCRLTNNIADTYGGAVYNHGKTGNASPFITNCLFYNNSALSAGAVYNLGSNGGNANAVITNCTFYGNHANVGGAIYCNAGEEGTGVSSPTISNCIFWENVAAAEGNIFRIIWGTPTISYSLVDMPDCPALYNGLSGSVTCGGGMVYNQEPMFANAGGADFHLLGGSPAVDDGSNDAVNQSGISVDLDSFPRIFNSIVDLGVYEFSPATNDIPIVTQNPQDLEVCEGETAIFSVNATGAQPLIFQWMKDGIAIPGANQNTLTIADAIPGDAGEYSCSVTNSTGVIVLSTSAMLSVNAPLIVSLNITSPDTAICDGEEVTLTAQAENEGSAPVFHWFQNGLPVGGNQSSLTAGNVNDGDVFTCTVTSSESCVGDETAASNQIVFQVEDLLEASVSIETISDEICEGQEVSFTATAVNGGSAPALEWILNGQSVGAGVSFSGNNFQNGDEIQCSLTSSKTCIVANPVSSNILTLEVQPVVQPSVAVTASVDTTFCIGTPVTFSVTTANADAGSVQWYRNNMPVGEGEPTLTLEDLADGDQVNCVAYFQQPCTESPVVSNTIVVSVDSCEVATEEPDQPEEEFILYPNPTKRNFFVKNMNGNSTFALRLLNIRGQTLLVTSVEHPFPGTFELDLSLFPKGMYFLEITGTRYTTVKKLVLQ